MHPLSGDLTQLKDSEIEEKIQDLTKKYFQTYNMSIKSQISMLLENYNAELGKRRQAQLAKLMANRDKSLDKLIKID
jgi:hypothetical protein